MITPLETIADADRIQRFTDMFRNHQRHPRPASARIGAITPGLMFYLMDGKVYQVDDATVGVIPVYRSSDFFEAVRGGEFPDYRPYKGMNTTTKRLVFSRDEIDCKGAGCYEYDEFVIDGNITATRNGQVAIRDSNGLIISANKREWAESVEEYHNPDTDEVVDQWRDTEVYEDGTIKRILPDVETTRPQRTGKGMHIDTMHQGWGLNSLPGNPDHEYPGEGFFPDTLDIE